MKILFITPSLNARSGWGRYSRAILQEHIRRGFEVKVLSQDAPEDTTYPVELLKSVTSRASVHYFLMNMYIARKAAKDFDAVFALDGWPYSVYAYAAVTATPKPLYLLGVGTYSVAPLYNRFSSFLMRRSYARARAVFCISSYTKDELAKGGVNGKNLYVAHFGASSLPAISSREVELFTKEAGLPAGAFPVVLTVGQIKERKGQMETLKAVGILKQHYPDIVYAVIGSGKHKEYVESMRSYAEKSGLKKNLLIVTNADDKTLAAFYTSSTVFALNSNSDSKHHHFEGFGLVVVEAAGYGKPAVGSSDSGVQDAIDDGVSGFLTGQRDPSDIADKIGKILEEYDTFSSNAKVWHKRFTWENMVEVFVKFYTARESI